MKHQRKLKMDNNSFSRRNFLKVSSVIGSGLAIGFHFPFGNKLMAAEAKEFKPNIFISVLPDDRILVAVAKAEMGQGVWTSLPMIVAEEMEADIAKHTNTSVILQKKQFWHASWKRL